MGKSSRVERATQKRAHRPAEEDGPVADQPIRRRRRPARIAAFEPRGPRQAAYAASIRSNTLTIGIGSAGTGKTYVAGSVAAELLAAGEVDRIILTRPAVESEERLGFMPGGLEEKYGHYLAPLRDVLDARMGAGTVEALLRDGTIKPVPFAFMRGLSWARCIVLADEMQNATKGQLKMLLTRPGEWTRVVVDGDVTQSDIPNGGLHDAIRRFEGRPDVGVVRFLPEDIVRSGFVRMVVEAYSEDLRVSDIEDPSVGLQRALAV